MRMNTINPVQILATFFSPISPSHIHPILVNFTAALVPASIGSDILGRLLKKNSLHDAAWWMLLYAALITPFTVVAGLLWKPSVAEMLPKEMLMTHQWLGISLAALFIILAVWRWSLFSRRTGPTYTYLGFAILVLAGLMYQGNLGGTMLLGP
jgi:uncharacterized membrane protein